MLVLDREAAVAAWRRAEAQIYPSVMVNAELYQQYIVKIPFVDELPAPPPAWQGGYVPPTP